MHILLGSSSLLLSHLSTGSIPALSKPVCPLQDRRLPFSLLSHPTGTAKMRQTRDDLQEWDLPYMKETIRLKPHDEYWLYDAKFYPYTTAGADPIFAIASIRHVIQPFPCFKSHQAMR